MRLRQPCVLSRAAAVAAKGTKRSLICGADYSAAFRSQGITLLMFLAPSFLHLFYFTSPVRDLDFAKSKSLCKYETAAKVKEED